MAILFNDGFTHYNLSKRWDRWRLKGRFLWGRLVGWWRR